MVDTCQEEMTVMRKGKLHLCYWLERYSTASYLMDYHNDWKLNSFPVAGFSNWEEGFYLEQWSEILDSVTFRKSGQFRNGIPKSCFHFSIWLFDSLYPCTSCYFCHSRHSHHSHHSRQSHHFRHSYWNYSRENEGRNIHVTS